MSYITLPRTDFINKQKSYLNIYQTKDLYKIHSKFRPNLLRIVKKSILGTNFIYYYSKQFLFISTIFNLIIININFLIVPQLLYHSQQFEAFFEDEKNIDNNKIINMTMNDYLLIRAAIINLIDIIFFGILIFKYKYTKNKINKYMEKYTQIAIKEENEQLDKYFYCNISKDRNFSIDIYLTDKTGKFKNNCEKKNINSEKYFFEYVINLPNIKYFNNNYIYKKILLSKEKEIVNNIISISNEIENKYRKRLLNFLLIMVFIIIYIPLIKIFKDEGKAKDIINYFGMLILILFVERDTFFKNKSEQIKKISQLNEQYINDGYYIYINNDMISIFFLKEKFRNKESINNVKYLNEKLMNELDIL